MKAGEVVQNVICCGHCQNTSIQRMAFSPNDSILVSPLGPLTCQTCPLQHLSRLCGCYWSAILLVAPLPLQLKWKNCETLDHHAGDSGH